MKLTASTTLKLIDAASRPIGTVTVERVEDDLVLGSFAREPAFTEHEPLFRQFEEAANAQALSLVDDLDCKIAALGLRVVRPRDGALVPTNDVQIWSDGGISFRVVQEDSISKA